MDGCRRASPTRFANSSLPVAGYFLTLRFRGHYLSRTAPAESHTCSYNIGRGVESPAQIVTIFGEINDWILDKNVAISQIDIEKAGWRPSKTGRKQVLVAVRNARRLRISATNGCFVISKAESKRKILCGIPFKSNGITQSVLVLEIQRSGGSTRIMKSNRDTLEAAPSLPGNVTHQRELPGEALIGAEVVDFRQVQLRSRVLIREHALKEIWLWKLDRRARSRKARHTPKSRRSVNIVSDPGPIANTDSPVLKESMFVAFPILEDSSEGKTGFPIVAADLRYAVPATRYESRIVISLSGRIHYSGYRGGGDT